MTYIHLVYIILWISELNLRIRITDQYLEFFLSSTYDFSGIRPPLQCPFVNIYRPRGRYDVPIIMGYLCLKAFNYRISLIWFNPKRYGNPLQNVKGDFLFEIVTRITDPLNIGIK